MITNGNERMSVGGGFLSVEEFYGLSTDTKPTNTANGSTFFEMDTGKMYRFNYSGTTWTETTHYGGDGFGPAPSGGGGGSTGGGVLVNLIWDDDTGKYTVDKTAGEILAANGAILFKETVSESEANYFTLYSIEVSESGYGITIGGGSGPILRAASASDYPISE